MALDDAEVEWLRGEVDALERELAAERFRTVAGMDPSPALQAIFRARSRAAHRETANALRERGDAALASRVAALRAERAAAADEEAWRAAESAATADGPEGARPLAEAEAAAVAEADRGRRRRLASAAARAIGAAAGAGEAAAERRAAARAEGGLTPPWEDVVEADAALAASDDAWHDVLSWLAARDGLAPAPEGDLERADLLHLLRLGRWSGHFRPGMLPLRLREALGGLGLPLAPVRVDAEDRPGKWPGVHVLEARVSFRRGGGPLDWVGLFQAAGHASAAGLSSPSSRDPAFPFAMGALAASLLSEPRFLERSLDVPRREARDLARAVALGALFELRARAAALRVAAEVERGTSGRAWRAAHREALSAAARAAWPDGLAARDARAGEHQAALRGAAWGDRLRADLLERFDEDFWRNPRTAPWIAGVLAAGRAGPEKERPPLASAAEALARRMEAGR
jgi:hypothetical protein